ncbi:MAG: hypothetical protein GDA44_14320 [Prochloron sp. SP5CPC1]|nr:hypothetical protein [Candidatus Paraprochloron terpiosi SP5CPC1]
MRKLLLALGFVGALVACTKEVEVEKIVYRDVEVVDTAEIERLQGVINGLESTISDLTATNTDYAEQIAYLQDELALTLEELETALDNSADEALIAEIQADVIRLEQELIVAEAQVIIEYVEVEVERIVEVIVTETEIVVDTAEIERLTALLAEAQETIDFLNSELIIADEVEADNENEIIDLQGDIHTLNGQIATLEAQVANLQAQVADLQAQLAEATAPAPLGVEGAVLTDTPTGRTGDWFAVNGGWIQRYMRNGVTVYQAWSSLSPLTPVGGWSPDLAVVLGNL